MRILAREGLCPAGRALAALLLLAAHGCGGGGGPPLEVAERIPLGADSAGTLFVARDGTPWVGVPGALRSVGAAGGRRLAVGGAEVPRVVGEAGGRILVRAGERVLSLDPSGAAPPAERLLVGGAVLPDPRGRWALRVAPDGEVRGLDPATLEALWVWPSLGDASAAAVSPEGDRLYVAVRGDGGSTLVVRDLQTGRALAGEPVSGEVEGVAVSAAGTLLASAGGALTALEPGRGGLARGWRRRLRSVGLRGAAEVRVAPRGERIAVLVPGNEAGLRVLDAETGEPLGRMAGPVLDAAFAADGAALYLLTRSEVRVARVP